jgi:hypothetical protein
MARGGREPGRTLSESLENPFTESLVSGVGTGTGLAIAAGVAGPAIVRRLQGAARKTGLISNPEIFQYDGVEVHWEGNFAAWASDWRRLYEMARRGERGLWLDYGGPSAYGDVQVRRWPRCWRPRSGCCGGGSTGWRTG